MSTLTKHRISLEEFTVDPCLGNFTEASIGQRVTMRLIDGLPPANAEQREMAAQLIEGEWTDRMLDPPRTAAIIAGASSGKSLIAANFALHRALFGSVAGLRPGQRGTALIVAPDVRLAGIPFRYALGVCETSQLVGAELEGVPTTDTIKFSRGSEITIRPASAGGRAVRGLRFLCAVLEESAFFRDADTGAVNDKAIYRAIRPRLLDLAQILMISTPYGRRGVLWDLYRQERAA